MILYTFPTKNIEFQINKDPYLIQLQTAFTLKPKNKQNPSRNKVHFQINFITDAHIP
jgi:hypothetical protein